MECDDCEELFKTDIDYGVHKGDLYTRRDRYCAVCEQKEGGRAFMAREVDAEEIITNRFIPPEKEVMSIGDILGEIRK